MKIQPINYTTTIEPDSIHQKSFSELQQPQSTEGDVRLQILENIWSVAYHCHVDQINHGSELAETVRSEALKYVDIST